MLKTESDKPIRVSTSAGVAAGGLCCCGHLFPRALFPCRSVNACAASSPRAVSKARVCIYPTPALGVRLRVCSTQPHTVFSRQFAIAACQHRALRPTTRLLPPLRAPARLWRACCAACSRFLRLRVVVRQRPAPLDTIRNNSNTSSPL